MQLKFTEDILPVTDFRNNAADILAQLAETGRPILLTQRGRAAAVLIDVHEYQRMCDRIEALERALHGTEATSLNGAAGEALASPEGAPTQAAASSPVLDRPLETAPDRPLETAPSVGISPAPASSRLTQIARSVDSDLVRELEKWIEEER